MEGRNLGKSFDIVLRSDSAEAPIPLESVSDANEATLAFHMQLQRLTCEGTTGELVLFNRNANDRRLEEGPVLRLRIG
jgi:hypothetical protein